MPLSFRPVKEREYTVSHAQRDGLPAPGITGNQPRWATSPALGFPKWAAASVNLSRVQSRDRKPAGPVGLPRLRSVSQSGKPLLQIQNPNPQRRIVAFCVSARKLKRAWLSPRKRKNPHHSVRILCLMWALLGSNQRPPACKAGALNQLS